MCQAAKRGHCGRAACTKPLLAAVFLFEFQRVKKYFEISLKKVLQLSKWFVYLYR